MKYSKYIKINKDLWNGKTGIHFNSKFYDVKNFIKGKSSLNYPELELLGKVKNKSILHLQCHFGMDSISLARMGAKVTAVDFSDKALKIANSLNKEIGTDVNFICSEIYNIGKILKNKFDIIFTSYGTIGWLPDLNKWGRIISGLLKKNGFFCMVEFHPFIFLFDDNFNKIKYSYFNTGVIVEEIKGTYADRNADFKHKSCEWSHPLSEVFNALTNNHLKIESFIEYPFSVYNCFNKTVRSKNGNWQIKKFKDRIPMMYSIRAVRGNQNKDYITKKVSLS